MKIGILTFHRAANYGAVLQAYALEKVICRLGHSCELIDYRNPSIEKTYQPLSFRKVHSLRNLASVFLRSVSRYQKRKNFRDFVSERCVQSMPVLSRKDFSLFTEYDVVVVGSDQVWNFDLTGEDYTYFGEFPDGKEKRASYAASIVVKNFPDWQNKRICSDLSRFYAISVRENKGKQYLESINIPQNVAVVLDPTLLLTKKDWMDISSHTKISEVPEKYVLVYFAKSNSDYYCAALEAAEHFGLKAVLINDFFQKPARGFVNIKAASPEQFLQLFQGADFVVTDSFHGTAFSVNFGVDFTFMLNREQPEKNDRILTLVKALGLEDRNFDNKPFVPIEDWDEVQRKLSELKEKSIRFLTEQVLN